MIKIAGAQFSVSNVAITEGARERCVFLQRRAGKGAGRPDDQMVSVHTAILLKLHATAQFGEILPSDRLLNRNNIARNEGRVLSVIGAKRYSFVIITELPDGNTLIATPEEV